MNAFDDDDRPFTDRTDDERCYWCGGEGFIPGSEMGDPLWYDEDESYPCPSCYGSGLRKDMVLG